MSNRIRNFSLESDDEQTLGDSQISKIFWISLTLQCLIECTKHFSILEMYLIFDQEMCSKIDGKYPLSFEMIYCIVTCITLIPFCIINDYTFDKLNSAFLLSIVVFINSVSAFLSVLGQATANDCYSNSVTFVFWLSFSAFNDVITCVLIAIIYAVCRKKVVVTSNYILGENRERKHVFSNQYGIFLLFIFTLFGRLIFMVLSKLTPLGGRNTKIYVCIISGFLNTIKILLGYLITVYWKENKPTSLKTLFQYNVQTKFKMLCNFKMILIYAIGIFQFSWYFQLIDLSLFKFPEFCSMEQFFNEFSDLEFFLKRYIEEGSSELTNWSGIFLTILINVSTIVFYYFIWKRNLKQPLFSSDSEMFPLMYLYTGSILVLFSTSISILIMNTIMTGPDPNNPNVIVCKCNDFAHKFLMYLSVVLYSIGISSQVFALYSYVFMLRNKDFFQQNSKHFKFNSLIFGILLTLQNILYIITIELSFTILSLNNAVLVIVSFLFQIGLGLFIGLSDRTNKKREFN